MSNVVTVIDYEVCNLFNLMQAFKKIGVTCEVVSTPEKIKNASKLLLPGVGAFGAGIKNLKNKDLIGSIQDFAKSGKPMMGICLGMQLLMSTSEELGNWEGLNLISGKVVSFKKSEAGEGRFKIPQIGWNLLVEPENPKNPSWKNSCLNGIQNPYVYFVHSFIVQPKSEENILATTNYGFDKFCSVIKKDNISGCQFHPELSGQIGLQILSNFSRNTI